MGEENGREDRKIDLETGRIPHISIVADNIPSAHYRAIRAVLEKGVRRRTDYDRKNAQGKYIDPVGADADVTIEVLDPYADLRCSPISYCEMGKYTAEMLGVKDHLVPSRQVLLEAVASGNLSLGTREDPYTYHQRLVRKPTSEGILNELQGAMNRLVDSPLSRRAVADTAIPEIDAYLREDIPCLRELQFRLQKNSQGIYVLNVHSHFRSHDLKAWGDNMSGITNLIQIEAMPYLAKRLTEEARKKDPSAPPVVVVMGSWKESNGSLHVYGQDLVDPGKAMCDFENIHPTEDSFIEKAKIVTRVHREFLFDEQLEGLLKERREWRFPDEAVQTIEMLREGFKSGRFLI